MLIKNARFVLTPGDILENKNIVIEDNIIKSVGGSDKKGEVIDASNHAVLPGLVNMHTHASMNLFRGVADDMEFWDAWPNIVWPLEEKLDGDKCYWGALHAFIEMIKSGTTCFNDMYFFMDRVAEAADDLGIRGYLGHGMLDSGDPGKCEKEIKEAERAIESIERDFSDIVKPVVTPHSPGTCSEELLLRSKEISEERKLPIHMHVAETEDEVGSVIEEKGMRPVNYLKDIGLLGEDFIGAHAVHVSEDEINILAESEASVVHNPCSNMKLVSGTSPVYDMIEKGVNVALGTDGVVSNNSLDMFEEMKFASLLQKVSSSDPTAMSAEEVLELPWKNAGKALGEKIGRVEEGYLADFVLVNLEDVGMSPVHSLRSNLVYSGAKIDTSIVNGEVVMKDNKLTKVDEEEVRRKAEEVAGELVSD